MPPKGRKRKNEISAEEQQIYDDMEALIYKYRHESEEDEKEEQDAGMFGDENACVHVESVPEIFKELNLFWDSAVLAVLKPEQKTVDFPTMKLLFKTLLVQLNLQRLL